MRMVCQYINAFAQFRDMGYNISEPSSLSVSVVISIHVVIIIIVAVKFSVIIGAHIFIIVFSIYMPVLAYF